MPTYVVTAPDGKEYEVDAPSGASQAAALEYFQANWKPKQNADSRERPALTPQQIAEHVKRSSRTLSLEGSKYEPSFIEKLSASPMGAAAMGATAPVRALGEFIPGAIGEGAKEANIYGNEAMKRGRLPMDTADRAASHVAEFGGSVAPYLAVPYLHGAAGILPKVGQYLGNIGIGTATGGLAGLLTPGQETDPTERAYSGAGVGALVSSVAPPLIRVIAKGSGWIVDAFKGRLSDVRAGKILRDVVGENYAAMKAAWGGSTTNETAAQLAAGVDNDVLQALGEMAKRHDTKTFYRVLADRQQVAELNQLAKMARGGSAEESAIARKLMGTRLEMALKPERETALHKSGIVGNEMKGIGEKIETLKKNISYTPEWGGASAEMQSEIAKSQRYFEQLQDAGLRKLSINNISSRIEKQLGEKITKMSDSSMTVLNAIKGKLQEASAGGITDPAALYALRKNGINEVIDTLDSTGKLSKDQAQRAVIALRPMIDDAFDHAGGVEFRGYLMKYRKGFEAIDRVEVMDALRKSYENNPKEFIDVIRGKNPEFVQKFIPTRGGITGLFSEKTTNLLNALASKAERKIKMGERSSGASTALADILNKDTWRFKFPSLISAKFAAANKILDVAETSLNKETMQKLVDGMKSGKSATELLNQLSTADRSIVLKGMMRTIKLTPAMSAGGALYGEQQ